MNRIDGEIKACTSRQILLSSISWDVFAEVLSGDLATGRMGSGVVHGHVTEFEGAVGTVDDEAWVNSGGAPYSAEGGVGVKDGKGYWGIVLEVAR